MIDYVDTHTHLFVDDFNSDIDNVIARAVDAGVHRMCLPCIDSSSIDNIKKLCNRFPGVCYPMIGLHPTDVRDDYLCQLELMASLLSSDDSFIAVGEVGIDLYWDASRRVQQLDAFEKQICWARDMHLPLVIHSRNAFDELYTMMDKFKNDAITGVFHCFSGSADEARKLLDFDGFVFGIGGVLTYKNSSLPQVLADAVPLERIVLETDSPYLAPVPHRGKRNESAFVVSVAERLANIYNKSVEQIANITTANAERVFNKIVKQ